MLPQEQQRGTIDSHIESINKTRPYSLLQNPRRYTVQVATFSGIAVMKPEAIQAIESGKGMPFDQLGSALERGEIAAVELCKFLRANGVEAYEFHDRFASIVTVGGFDQPSRQMPDGTMIADPRIQQTIQQYRGRTINGVQCSTEPRLIEVPRVARR
jgi:hypothetical protein